MITLRRFFALLIVVAAVASAGCGGNTDVALGQLAEFEQTYIGQQVVTRGVVRNERDPDGSSYFVLSDPHGVLVGLEPAGSAAQFKGKFVQVSGLFDVQPGFGRVIHIATIAPAEAGGG